MGASSNFQITSLFAGKDEFKELENAYKSIKKKRVHYSTPTYTKVYKNDTRDDGIVLDDSKWGRMKNLYAEIANFAPFPFGFPDEVYETKFLRVWKAHYTKDFYYYKGDDGVIRSYMGQEFDVFEAEIKGTENLHIDSRLQIHQRFLDNLKLGQDIENALKKALAKGI